MVRLMDDSRSKKVIFIGGTSFSGSTFLDMILANDPKGFSCGEVYALYNPYRPHHINPKCGCGNSDCQIWNYILAKGDELFYETIFNLFPSVNFIVDSSKDPFWILKQSKRLFENGALVKNVLIWKTPLEAAASFKKRDRLAHWERGWVNYHRLYFTMIDKFISLKYKDLASKNYSAFRKLCNYLGIDYFEEKYHYWTKVHHTLFGNTSAKVHLYSKDSENFRISKYELEKTSDKMGINYREQHKNIYYKTVQDADLIQYVCQREMENNKLTAITEALEQFDISSNKVAKSLDVEELKYNPIVLRAKEFLRNIKNKFDR